MFCSKGSGEVVGKTQRSGRIFPRWSRKHGSQTICQGKGQLQVSAWCEVMWFFNNTQSHSCSCLWGNDSVLSLMEMVVTESKTAHSDHHCCSSWIRLERDHKLHHENTQPGNFWRAWTICWFGKRLCAHPHDHSALHFMTRLFKLCGDFIFCLFRCCVLGWWVVTAARRALTWCWQPSKTLWNTATRAKCDMLLLDDAAAAIIRN